MNIQHWSDQDKVNLGNYLQWNSYRSERYRIFYVATPKAGCTTLKWWFASLEGYSQELQNFTNNPESDPELVVHHSHMVAPLVNGLQFSEISSVLDSDAYFKFAVVRNPYKRIFSAWQSKLLLREPLQIGPYIEKDFYHYPIATAADIAKSFESFLEHLVDREAPSYWDHHWTPQADLLRPELISYSCLTKIEDCGELIQKLRERLGSSFLNPFQGRRANESLIPYVPELITQRSAGLIRSLYARDFDIFEYDKQLPPINETFSAEQFDLAIRAIKFIRARHQCLGERNGRIQWLNQAVNERDGQIHELNHTVNERDGQIHELNHAVNERDGQIHELNHAVNERDGQIHELNHAVNERDGQILELNHAVNERDGQILELNHAVSERDGQISFQNEKVHELLKSHSWTVTKPLRLISTKLMAGLRASRDVVNRSPVRISVIQQLKIRRIRLNELFDGAFYIEKNPDVGSATIDPATHYYLFGWREHRDPSAKFSTRHYLECHPDVATVGINPLLNYIEYGKAEGRQIQPADDNSLAQPKDDLEMFSGEPTLDQERINAEVEAIRNSGLFDAAYYVAMYPDIQSSEDLIRHYCERGWREGRNPSDDFDTRGYLTAFSDINNAGLNPFWHYVIAGRSESREARIDIGNRYEDDCFFGDLSNDIRLIAYYAKPNWGAVKNARNSIRGATLALMPHEDLGFYATSNPDTLAKQALMARRHGISAWCFGSDTIKNNTVGDSLRDFLSNRDIDIKFILDIDLRSSRVDEQMFISLKNALADERYLKIAGRPVVVMTLPEGDRHCVDVLKAFSVFFANFPSLYRIVRRDGPPHLAADAVRQFALEAVLDFPVSPIPGETGSFKPLYKNGFISAPYSVVVSQAIARMGGGDGSTVPCYRTITLGRDGSPLKSQGSLHYTRFALKNYRQWLDAAISDVRNNHDHDRRLLFINAWNDWNQGAVLEPDRSLGYSKLNETSRALLDLPLGQALPKVSIVVPNYNHARYLPRRLECIYHQTYANIEVLLLDDCSTDESRDVLKEYADRYPEVSTLMFNLINSGSVFRQWAKGIKAAKGDLIWIAESDDYCDENFLEKLVRCFDDESVMLAYARTEFVQADECVMPNDFRYYVQSLNCGDKWECSYVNTAHKEVSEALGIINTIPNASGAIFRRPVDMPLLEDDSWLSMRVAGDWIFYLHQLRGGRIAYSTETTNYFRRHEKSTAAITYKKDLFYRELGRAAQTVTRLYDVSSTVIEKAYERSKMLYDHFCASSEEKFIDWFNINAVFCEQELRKPNILISTMDFQPGGAEILPLRMANELKRQGHSVLLLSTGLSQREDGVRRLLRRDIPVVETSDVELTKKLISDFGIEVLNSHQWHVQKYPVLLSDVFAELKAHVASLHGMIENDAFAVTTEQLQAANENVSVWVYTADKNLTPFIEHGLYQDDSPRFKKLPNGMEPPLIRPISRSEIGVPEDAFVLCCVSRAIPDKGWAEAIEAVSLAREATGKDIRLILVGNGPVYDEYCHSGVSSFVHLAGFSENSVGYYAVADVGIMLTKFKSESFPLTIVDCLFAGRPYIATAVGEIRNMLTTERGFAGHVVDLEDWEVPVNQVARIISTYATDADVLRSSREQVVEVANRYRIDNVAKQYVSIFEQSIRVRRKDATTVH